MRQRLTTEVSTAHLTGLPAKHKGFMAAPFIGSLDAQQAVAKQASLSKRTELSKKAHQLQAKAT